MEHLRNLRNVYHPIRARLHSQTDRIFIFNYMKTKKEKTFKCDGCGKEKPIKEKFKVYDENYRLQKGIFECAKCKGL